MVTSGIKDKVLQILEAADLTEKRAAKLDTDDFLALLNSFNEAGIHFT